MTSSDVKDQILHSLGTLTAVELVIKARLLAYPNPSGQQVAKLVEDTLTEFERGFVLQITNSS